MRRTSRLLGGLALLALAGPARPALDAGGGSPGPGSAVDRDFERARGAIEAKQWGEAVRLLEKVAARQARNPDVHNLLGYAERSRGNLDAAFSHYETALRLDPKHRGAHEYVAEAYLQRGDLAKAKEHLAALGKICAPSCAEYRELGERIAAYERDHHASR